MTRERAGRYMAFKRHSHSKTRKPYKTKWILMMIVIIIIIIIIIIIGHWSRTSFASAYYGNVDAPAQQSPEWYFWQVPAAPKPRVHKTLSPWIATYLEEGNSEIKPEVGRQDINSEPVTSKIRAGFDEMTQGIAPLPCQLSRQVASACLNWLAAAITLPSGVGKPALLSQGLEDNLCSRLMPLTLVGWGWTSLKCWNR